MNRKVVVSVVLTVCLVLSVFPIGVKAEQTTILEMLLNMIFPKPELPSGSTHIKILNPVSSPTLWGRWVVNFETEGKGDLEIQAYEKTYFGKSIEFIRLQCGNREVKAEKYFSDSGKNEFFEGVSNGKIIARDWECSEKARLVLRILETGHHYLKFSFLGEDAYAENWADCTGTDVSPCHCCDVSQMWVTVTAPSGGGDSGPHGMTYQSSEGSCSSSPYVVNETWTYDLGYTFCPTEGTYVANVTAYAAGGDQTCSAYENETINTTLPSLYTVNWDTDENWCNCKQGTTGCSGGSCWGPTRGFGFDTGTSANCCGDDSGENYLTGSYGASIENPPASTDACCNPSTDCVDADTCYATSGTKDVDSNGDDDVCSSSTWIDCTDTSHCDPAGEYAEGETSDACYGSTDCSEACTSNDCIYKRYNGYSDCDLETACVSGNCMQDTEYAGTAGAGVCDNADGCICNTCDSWDVCIPTDGCPFDNDWDEAMQDCYNPADQGGNCYASNGDTNKDVDNDGDSDYCNAGTWYDCNTDSQCDTASGYHCNTSSNDCTLACTQNSDCPSGFFCNASTLCQAQKSQGGTCDFSVTNTDSSSESNGVCSSGYCRDDYDGSSNADGNCDSGDECWCANAGNCMHDGSAYTNGANAPDCYDNGSSSDDAYSWICNSGDWNTNNCGSNNYCIGGSCTACTTSECLSYQSCRDGNPCCDTDSECGSNKICVSEQINNNQGSCSYTYQCRDVESLSLGVLMTINYSQGAYWSGDSSGNGKCGDHGYTTPSNPDGDLCLRYNVYDADGNVNAIVTTTEHNTNVNSSTPASGNDEWRYNYIYNASDTANFHQLEIREWDTGFGYVLYGYYISEAGSGADGTGSIGCCPNSTDCVDDSLPGSNTTNQDGCYDNGTIRDTGGGDGSDNEVCLSSLWYAQDSDQTSCELDGNTWLSSGTGSYSKCCGDDGANDDFENSGSGNSCCINGETVTNGTTDSSNQYLCIDGEIYGCNGNLGGVATQDSSCTRRVGYYCDGAGTGANTWKQQIGQPLTPDDCDGIGTEYPYGSGEAGTTYDKESCVGNAIWNDHGNGPSNQDQGYQCLNQSWNGPHIGQCYLTQSGSSDQFKTLTIRWDVADETPDTYSNSGHHRWRIDDDGSGTGACNYGTNGCFYDTGLRNWCNDTDSNEGTYGDYYEITMDWSEFATKPDDETTYYLEIGEEECGSGQINDTEDPNSNEGSCTTTQTLCVPMSYSAIADSDCCPTGGTTSEYPGKDDEDGKCVRCWTNNKTQREGATGNDLCEQKCGASPQCDEHPPGFSNATISCSLTCQVNAKPTHSDPLINSTSGYNMTSDNITCWNQSTYDEDGDSVTNIYNWYKNNKSIMVLNMPFDTKVTNGTKDYSGYANNGILYGPNWTSSGKVGGAYEFDGVNAYVDVGNDISLAPENITLSLWVKTYENTSVTGWNGIVKSAKGDGYSSGWRLLDYNNYPRVQINFGGSTPQSLWGSSYKFPINEFVHVAFTYDGQIARLYVNGQELDNLTNSSGINWQGTSDMQIGVAQNYFNGSIDQVRIYNYSLSPEQVNALYQDSKDGYSYKSTMVSQETDIGDQWRCEVTPSDGVDDGITKNSSVLVVNDDSIDGGHGTTCDATNKCLLIQNSTGSVKARFDKFGYVDVKGSYSPAQSSLSPPANSFILKDSGGSVMLYIDSSGNLAAKGYFYKNGSPTPSGNDDFIVQDSGGNVVGYIDSATGNMYFKGVLHYNSDF